MNPKMIVTSKREPNSCWLLKHCDIISWDGAKRLPVLPEFVMNSVVKEKARRAYQADASDKCPDNTKIFAADMQLVILLPRLTTKEYLFVRKDDYVILWHEAIAVHQNLKKAKRRQARYADTKTKSANFQVGDPVYVENHLRTSKLQEMQQPYHVALGGGLSTALGLLLSQPHSRQHAWSGHFGQLILICYLLAEIGESFSGVEARLLNCHAQANPFGEISSGTACGG
ncbi:hypothetical protein LOTGIDRAFT_175647 [Lottia gigantea]|uniref:Uncharacterized protein n=1 Tax=Lottia gigantea TaxID=225164 RepID=V3ZNI1_LOTGI|nr:hypothetical protein LOTGIDRAFT_175647 [Lottia gigantea]ESO92918.1 hypothetical protein LOTGIDRAFT_175647 [Lottia gigantea]